MKVAIAEAKKKIWQRLVDTVNEDPWGMPYKMIRNKLK